MLLASAWRRLGRDDDALDLLQAERLRAASFVLSSLMQEVGMRDDAAFARAAGDAAEAVFTALDLGALNPFFSTTMAFEVAEALRRAGEPDGALAALAKAVRAAADIPEDPGPVRLPALGSQGRAPRRRALRRGVGRAQGPSGRGAAPGRASGGRRAGDGPRVVRLCG